MLFEALPTDSPGLGDHQTVIQIESRIDDVACDFEIRLPKRLRSLVFAASVQPWPRGRREGV